MKLHQFPEGDVLILAPEGTLDASTAPALDRTLTEVIDQGARRILVDGVLLEYMSSVGLRVLLVAAKRLKPHGGQLALCRLSDHLRNVFALSGFDNVFAIYPDQPAALAALRADRA